MFKTIIAKVITKNIMHNLKEIENSSPRKLPNSLPLPYPTSKNIDQFLKFTEIGVHIYVC